MSPPIPSSRALRALRSQLDFKPYRCASCLSIATESSRSHTRRQIATSAPRRQNRTGASSTRAARFDPPNKPESLSQNWQQRRRVTYVAPVTSVNAARAVPERNRELHTALSLLESTAAEYVNLSQLALALRGLEAKDPVTRIAIQSSVSFANTLRLIRLILKDGGNNTGEQDGIEQDWENDLLRTSSDGRALLIRYGPTFDIDSSNPLVLVISVPGLSLERHRLELLIVQRNDREILDGHDRTDAQVTYPVHKTLFFSGGIKGLLTAQYEDVDPENRWNISQYSVVDIENLPSQRPLPNKGLTLISLDRASRDVSNSYINDVHNFLFTGILPSTTLKPLHRAYIQHVLATATARLAAEETAVGMSIPSIEELETSLGPLRAAVASWSESAHTELRNELTNAFAGHSWRKLAWWKLPFRVDDVGMIGSDILRRFYLADAEKGVVWLGGRLEQAGLTHATNIAREAIANDTETAARAIEGSGRGVLDPIPAPRLNTFAKRSKEEGDRNAPDTYFRAGAPWPQQIAMSRGLLLSRALPALQARAQALLLETLSGTSLSAAIGALAYAMVSTTGVYEAGSVFALGAVISLGRLQSLWDKAKDDFAQDVHNEGRIVIEEVGHECKDVVNRGIETHNPEGQKAREVAGLAIHEANEALERLT